MSERTQVLFEEVAGLAHDLRKAIATANKIKGVNENVENIGKVIQQYAGIESRVDELIGKVNQATDQANRAAQRAQRTSAVGWLGAAIGAVLICAALGLGAGAWLGYKAGDATAKAMAAQELDQLRAAREVVTRLQAAGARFYVNAIVPPDNDRVVFGRTTQGDPALFVK